MFWVSLMLRTVLAFGGWFLVLGAVVNGENYFWYFLEAWLVHDFWNTVAGFAGFMLLAVLMGAIGVAFIIAAFSRPLVRDDYPT